MIHNTGYGWLILALNSDAYFLLPSFADVHFAKPLYNSEYAETTSKSKGKEPETYVQT